MAHTLFRWLGIVFLCTTSSLALPGDFEWAWRFSNDKTFPPYTGGNVVPNAYGRDTCFDAEGNIVVIGNYDEIIEDNAMMCDEPTTGNGALVAKLDPSGQCIWKKHFTAEDIWLKHVKLDGAGNVYIIGLFEGTVDFDPGPGSYMLTGMTDMCLIKLTSEGEFIWAGQIGPLRTPAWEFHGASFAWDGNWQRLPLDVDFNGNVFVSVIVPWDLSITMESIDLDPSTSVHEVAFSDAIDLNESFIIKVNPQCELEWARKFRTMSVVNQQDPSDVYISNISVGPDGTLYGAGVFSGFVDFDPGPGENILATDWYDVGNGITFVEVNNPFALKLDSSGSLVWARHVARGTSTDLTSFIYEIATDADGNLYMSGNMDGTFTFGEGPGSIVVVGSESYGSGYIVKYTAAGQLLWAREPDVTSQPQDFVTGISVDNENNLYVMGKTGDFESESDNVNHFIAKLTPDGAFGRFWEFPGFGSSIYINSIDVSQQFGIVATGMFWLQGTDFDPGPNTFQLVPHVYIDGFMFKLAGTPLVAPVVQSISLRDANPTSSRKLGFEVHFSESVTGVDEGDFAVIADGLIGARVDRVQGNGSVWSVIARTGNGSGTLELVVIDNNSIVGAGAVPLGGPGIHNGGYDDGDIYTVQRDAVIVLQNYNRGGEISRSDVCNVKWTSGAIGPKVRIELWRNAKRIAVLAASTRNDGSQKVTIPTDVLPGIGYRFRVLSTKNPAIYSESKKPFTVVN